MVSGRNDRCHFHLGSLQSSVDARLQVWEEERYLSRLRAKDPTLWSSRPVPELDDRLGWLDLPESMQDQAAILGEFAEKIRSDGVRHVVLLGMGGSSLAPEVLQKTFGNRKGYPELLVLDSTHPGAVRETEKAISLPETLFIVSSKSGTTTETLSFFYYFWKRIKEISREAGRQFVAITDPGTPLERLARERGFRAVFQAPADVGGRYSALTVFGLVPAALIGVDIGGLVDAARRLSDGSSAAATREPGLALGASLAEAALAGKDKLTFLSSPSLTALPTWVEQLIAESTGKDARGILPVVDEPLGDPGAYGADRFFVGLSLSGEDGKDWRNRTRKLEGSGHPWVQIDIPDKIDLGEEFFRWEVAVAAAGSGLGIHPFNQPDVELAKELARKAMRAQGSGTKSDSPSLFSVERPKELGQALSRFLGHAKPGDYLGLQAFLAPASTTTEVLQAIRLGLRDRLRAATTLGYGPRFLHSTGQFHKGGPNSGLFIQFVDEPSEDFEVPETDYRFGGLLHAQALGDFQALEQRGRRIFRVHLGRDVLAGMKTLRGILPA